jgi:disulfide bond formation protein DsbB
MECNVGGTDRTARIGLGAALLTTGMLAPIGKPLKIASGILGTISLITGITRYCPINKATGRNTCTLE